MTKARDLSILISGVNTVASEEQAATGLDNTTVMTPLRTAEAIASLAPRATTEQALVGLDNTTVMTPLRTAEAIAALAPTSGIATSLAFE